MKTKVNKMIDWFEEKFNFIIDVLALIGGAFCILFAITMFVILLFDSTDAFVNLEFILIPGLLGFFGIIMLFALRITRHITKK